MKLDDLLKHTSEWLKGTGPNSDIVISTRIRLARNLNKLPFPHWANKKQSGEALQAIEESFNKVDYLKKATVFKLAEINSIDKQLLVERHLMSFEHTQKTDYKAVAIEEEEIVAIMINEEDHMRIQVMQSGFNLFEAWNIINRIDECLAKELSIAYSSDWGYLTACPTNAGTAMRGSVMLHLPALVMTRSIDRVLAAISKLSFTTRGLYGEGTQATGNFFQISNQVSLGLSEDEIVNNINGLIRQIIEQEKQARELMLSRNKSLLEDRVYRSLGILKSARIITSQETTELLSMVRLGVDLEMVKDINRQTINELFIITQPAHLQKIENKKLSSNERDSKRAELIRSKLKI
ncbi:MAG: protein arginine kinase [Candidatus Omnitrophica bacterium]|nr:protein arginine kinase [Candidatus Omnitrophota bacterium]MBU1091211.1 protein arginine kinase [Candidatus Omnitrophota bacterium]MBU1905972.1 protein arginine kinase [Candidatus Omnitrophota bacterium]